MPDSAASLDHPVLILRADANARMGHGHMMRCLALAQAWSESGGHVVFVSHCESETLRRRVSCEGFDLVPLAHAYPDAADFNILLKLHHKLEAGGRHAIVVVDGYQFDAVYQEELFQCGIRFLCIDDHGHAKRYWADWLLNPNASATPRLYEGRAPRSRLLLGSRYALLRREFRALHKIKRHIPRRARRLLVTMGGSDPANATAKVIEALARLGDVRLEVRILAGADNPRRVELRRQAKSLGREAAKIRIISKTDEMPKMMMWADLAVSAGGSTCWEMAALGLPNIVISIASNQVEIARSLAREGVSINLGRQERVQTDKITQALKALISDGAVRAAMSRKGRMIVDGSGALKICAMLRESLS